MKKKAHKTRRQLIAEKASTASKLVEKANGLHDPLESLVKYHKYTTKDNELIELKVNKVKNLPEETVKWICDLMERNMKSFYEKSNWGWNAIKKQEELTEDNAWYLIATCQGKQLGFSHFRFDLDDQVEVLYCYELQLEPLARRKGLGRFMIQILEVMATRNQMQKIVLTVLKNNPLAMSFFQKLGFKVDITSPPESEDYVILSKQHLQKA